MYIFAPPAFFFYYSICLENLYKIKNNSLATISQKCAVMF